MSDLETAAESAPQNLSPTQFPCEECGAVLTFAPGMDVLKCQYCGHENPIPESGETVEELDYHAALRQDASNDETVTEKTIKCGTCAAEFTLDAKVTSDECPFCGSTVVLDSAAPSTVLKPKSLLPFKLDHRQARDAFKKWLSSRWFAPGGLDKYARDDGALSGMYTPYWTYDSDTTSHYRGLRGINYTVTVGSGKNRRTVTKTRWTPVSGTVRRFFDDVLVLASNSLPRNLAERLEPWDLENLVPYDDSYLSGFRSEKYQIGLEDAFDYAKQIMERGIRSDVRRQIGGDKQRILSLSIRHDAITYKHVLLPVWLAAYKFRDKTYRFTVNARTGEVQGERPWSWLKIAAAVLGVVVVAGGLYYAYVTFGGGG
ncbi:MAG: hypothetical protein H6842_01660 [Rhodospirillaceae bacterium]|nr:hypothetical protein [Rhodospirillaceae bacterium]